MRRVKIRIDIGASTEHCGLNEHQTTKVALQDPNCFGEETHIHI